MLTFFDYLPSQNAFKVRLLLNHLQIPHRSEIISIFEGAGKTPEYRRINPTGAVVYLEANTVHRNPVKLKRFVSKNLLMAITKWNP